MPQPKTTLTAALLLGAALGAGGDELARPRLDVVASPTALRISPDGYGLDVAVRVGAGGTSRILNWDRKGDAPLLDGQAFDNDDARAIGHAAAAFVKIAEERAGTLAGVLVRSPSGPSAPPR